jgi:hypothetical protein
MLEALQPHLLPKVIPTPVGLLFSLLLIVLALVLMFAGRTVIKAVAFLTAGIAGALAGLVVGGSLLGVLGAIAGAIVGFLLLGFIGYSLIYLGVGLALGYFAFELAKSFTTSFTIEVVVGVIFFIIGVVLTNKILELVTAFLGGLLLYDALTYLSVPQPLALIASIILAVLGLFVQMRGKSRHRASTSVPQSV